MWYSISCLKSMKFLNNSFEESEMYTLLEFSYTSENMKRRQREVGGRGRGKRLPAFLPCKNGVTLSDEPCIPTLYVHYLSIYTKEICSCKTSKYVIYSHCVCWSCMLLGCGDAHELLRLCSCVCFSKKIKIKIKRLKYISNICIKQRNL